MGSRAVNGSLSEASESRSVRHPIQSSSAISLNVLCLIGATIGIAAIALPWRWTRAGLAYEESILGIQFWDLLTSYSSHVDYLIGFGLYVGGAILSFATPLAGIPQAIGLTELYLKELERQESFRDYGTYQGGFAVGFVIACLSSVLVLVSLIKPLGVGYEKSPLPWAKRLRVWTIPKTVLHCRNVSYVLGKHKEWALAWIAASLLVVTLVLAVDYPYHGDEPLVEVEGGVMWVVDFSLITYLGWNSSILSVNDSIQSVVWHTQSESLANGTWASEEFGVRDLPGLALVLTVMDWRGDGRHGPGDCLILTTANGTSFADGVTYRIIFSDSHLYWPGPRSYVTITFEFRNGDLHSQGQVGPRGIIM